MKERATFWKIFEGFLFSMGKRWLAFLYPPLPAQSNEGLPNLGDWADEKLPGLRVALRIYTKRITDAGITVAFGGLIITLLCSWIWPFFVGSSINIFFIGILLKYRSQIRLQYPIIAHDCLKNILLLVFIGVATIATLSALILHGQKIRVLPGM